MQILLPSSAGLFAVTEQALCSYLVALLALLLVSNGGLLGLPHLPPLLPMHTCSPAPSSEIASAMQTPDSSYPLLRLFELLFVCVYCLTVVLFLYISFLEFKIHEDTDGIFTFVSLTASLYRGQLLEIN